MCYGFLRRKTQPQPSAAKPQDQEDNDAAKSTCDVCLEDRTAKEFVHLPCGHRFCARCVRQWTEILDVPTCPNCRTELIYKACKHSLPPSLLQPGSQIPKGELAAWCRSCSNVAKWVPGYSAITHVTASAKHFTTAAKREVHTMRVMASGDWPVDADQQRERLQAEQLEWEARRRESREDRERRKEARRQGKRCELTRRLDKSPAEKKERQEREREAWEATRRRVAAETGDWGFVGRTPVPKKVH